MLNTAAYKHGTTGYTGGDLHKLCQANWELLRRCPVAAHRDEGHDLL